MKDNVVGHAEALAKALADLTAAFLSRNRGCFPIDKVTDEQKHWNRAMKRAYDLIGQPNTPQRGMKLADYCSLPAAEVVAWRWHWLGGDEPDVWAYSETKPTSGLKHVEPLYATPALAGTEPAGEVVELERKAKAFDACDWYWPEDDTSSDACNDNPFEVLENSYLNDGEVLAVSRGGVVETRYYASLPPADDSDSDDRFDVDEPTYEAAKTKIAAEQVRRAALRDQSEA